MCIGVHGPEVKGREWKPISWQCSLILIIDSSGTDKGSVFWEEATSHNMPLPWSLGCWRFFGIEVYIWARREIGNSTSFCSVAQRSYKCTLGIYLEHLHACWHCVLLGVMCRFTEGQTTSRKLSTHKHIHSYTSTLGSIVGASKPPLQMLSQDSLPIVKSSVRTQPMGGHLLAAQRLWAPTSQPHSQPFSNQQGPWQCNPIPKSGLWTQPLCLCPQIFM